MQPTPSVAAVADVLALIGRDGWLTPPIRPIVFDTTVRMSRARTFRLEMGNDGPGLTPLYDSLSSDMSGNSLVLDAQFVQGAVWGEILATAAKNSGLTAAVVAGSVRDRPAVEAIGVLLYAINECVVGPAGKAHVREVGSTLNIGGTLIDNDDVVITDDSGCVVIPAAISVQVLDAARDYITAEESVLLALESGEPLRFAYIHKKRAVAAILDKIGGI